MSKPRRSSLVCAVQQSRYFQAVTTSCPRRRQPDLRPEIYTKAVGKGLVDTSREGKTPWATMAAAFYTDIKKNKAGGATFKLISKGHFGLTEAALSGKISPRPAATHKEADEESGR